MGISEVIQQGLKDKRLLVVSGIALLLSVRFPLIGMLFLCLAVTHRLPIKVTTFEKFILSLLLVPVINILLYEVLSIVHLQPPQAMIGALYAITGFSLLAYLAAPKKAQDEGHINGKIIACMVAAIITFLITLYPVFNSHKLSPSGETTMHLLMSGEDNASHYALFKYAYENNGYAYQHNRGSGLIESLVNYPQGSNFTMAWVAEGVLGNAFQQKDRYLIQVYYLLLAAYYALFVLLIGLIASRLFEIRKSSRSFAVVGGVVLTCTALAFITIGPALSLLGRGFSSQIFAYVYLLGLVYILSFHKTLNNLRLTLLAALLTVAGICTSWWFLCPLAGLPFLFFLYEKRQELLALRRSLWIFVPIILLCMYPIILSILSSTKSSPINEAGGVDRLDWTTTSLYALGAISLIFIAPLSKRFRPLVIMLGGCVLFAAAVGLFQLATAGKVEYYFYKSIYTLIPFSMIAILVVALTLSEKISASLRVWQAWVLAIWIIAVGIICLFSFKPTYARVYLNDWFSNPLQPSMLTPIFDQHNRLRYDDVLYMGGCEPGPTYLGNRWSGAVYLSASHWRSKMENATMRGDTDKIISLLKKRPHGADNLYIVFNNQCLSPKLKNYITEQKIPNNL